MDNNVIASYDVRDCKVVCVECGYEGRYEVRAEYTGMHHLCGIIFRTRIVHFDRDKAFNDFMKVKDVAKILSGLNPERNT